MNTLYDNLSDVYEMMYDSFINYEEEYRLYSEKLSAHRCTSVVEIGCGTGRLAEKFIGNGWNYTGLDLSENMLNKAKARNFNGRFIEADMRNFDLDSETDACIITGRTISYLLANQDVAELFKSLHANLIEGGIICFDFIDANKFIPSIKGGKKIIHNAEFRGRKFCRESIWSLNPEQNWTFNWQSVYYEEINGDGLKTIGEDHSVIRSFTADDITLFLQLSGFSVKEIIERPSYAFDTLVCTAQNILNQ